MGWWASNNVSFTKEVHPTDKALVLLVVKNYFPDWRTKELKKRAAEKKGSSVQIKMLWMRMMKTKMVRILQK